MISGVWAIQNPDKGETLAPGEELIIGGEVVFDLDEGLSDWKVTCRGDDFVRAKKRWTGTVEVLGNSIFRIEFPDGETEVLAKVKDGRLVRISRTTMTREASLSLLKIADRCTSTDTRLPGILFVTMPKSGSIYISRSLAQGLGIREMKVAVSLFPDDLVIRPKLDLLALGNVIAQQHIPASNINLRHIAARISKIAVHVRDPRQATISWMHHLQNFHAHRDTIPACAYGLEATTPAMPPDYFNWSHTEQIDWLIDHHFTQLVEWTKKWVDAEQSLNSANILFTRHEDLAQDRELLLKNLLQHFGIAPSLFDWSLLREATPQTHFRKGQTDEWREVLSDAQKRRAQALIPEFLAVKFGWEMC